MRTFFRARLLALTFTCFPLASHAHEVGLVTHIDGGRLVVIDLAKGVFNTCALRPRYYSYGTAEAPKGVSQEHVDYLIEHPTEGTKRSFDQKFGEGQADRLLQSARQRAKLENPAEAACSGWAKIPGVAD